MRMRRRSRAFAPTSSTGMICSCSSCQAYQTKTANAPMSPRIASHQMYQMTAKPQTVAKKAQMTPGRRVDRHFDRLVIRLVDQPISCLIAVCLRVQ